MTLLYLAIYLTGIIGLSYYFSLKNTESDFLIAGRNRPMWQIMLSKIAVSVGTGFFLIYTAYTYQYGWSSLLLLLFFTISFFLFAFWAVPKIYRGSREGNFLTMGDFVAHHFKNKSVGRLVDLVTVVAAFIWILSTFIGGAKVLSAYLEISYVAAVLVTTTLVGGYTLLSGYRAVIITDIAQAVIIFGLLGLAIQGLFIQADWSTVSSTLTEPFPLSIVIGIAIFGFFSTFSGADRYQLIYSARSEKTAIYGTALGIIPFVIAFIPIILIGLFMRSQVPGLDPDIVFMYFIENFSSATYISLAGVMLVAGLMSTLDSWIYAIATHLKSLTAKSKSNLTSLSIRKNIILVCLLLSLFALFFRDLLAVAILGVIVIITPSIAMFYTLCSGKYSRRFAAAITGSMGATFLGLFVFGITPDTLIFPILGGVLGLLIPLRWLNRAIKKASLILQS